MTDETRDKFGWDPKEDSPEGPEAYLAELVSQVVEKRDGLGREVKIGSLVPSKETLLLIDSFRDLTQRQRKLIEVEAALWEKSVSQSISELDPGSRTSAEDDLRRIFLVIDSLESFY